MTQKTSIQATFFPNTKAQAVFGELGPQPQFLWNETNFKVILGALEPGQQIPVHPEGLAMYHFLDGIGVMTVDDTLYPITAGATVITPAGARRGMSAETRLVFLATKLDSPQRPVPN